MEKTVPALKVLLIFPAGPERDQVVQALRVAGHDVHLGSRRDDPAARSGDRRFDLLVVGAGPGEGDPSAVASAWTNSRSRRPRAVVLIETLRAIDRLRALAAGVDAVITVERMVRELQGYAATMARAGAPPSSVLLVEGDHDRGVAIATVLEQASIRVVRCPLAQGVRERLDRESPDLVIVATQLPDTMGDTVSRMIRQDPRFQLLPVLFLGPGETRDQIGALRAGADDFLPYPVDPELLLHTVIVRAERSRRLRELLHRDQLTGLLNQATLIAELEYDVEFSRRHGGALAFVVFDLERFHEVNERFGNAVGDQVLLHVATVFRASVRASDVIGRFSGEQFGMILRGGGPDGAALLASKLGKILGAQSASTSEGIIIPLHVSVGWACFPGDGNSAGELVHAAVRALQREKSEK